jgi:S-adenosylmethionine hydrolase
VKKGRRVDAVKRRLPDTKTRGSDSKKSNPRVFSSSSISRPPHFPVSKSPRRRVRPITLITDFGTADYFAGALKGVILSINPHAQIVDITHKIPPHDVEAGAFTLLAAYRSFPIETIHVAVVDPGVGSSRRPILVEGGGHLFVGPDNGIFSYIYDREADHRVFHLTNEDYFRQSVSATFHGRDVFAPVAAAVSTGVKPEALGKPIKDHIRLRPLAPEQLKNGEVAARLIQIDRFGNCITNLTRDYLTTEMIEAGARLTLNGKSIRSFRRFFAEETGNKEKLFAIWGSAGFLEIAAVNYSAAKFLEAKRGDTVIVS